MSRNGIFQRLVTGVLAGAILLTACQLVKPSDADIVGTWVEQPRSEQRPPACGAFVFFDGGRFTAHQLPRHYFDPSGYSGPARIDAQGSWTLDVTSSDPFAVHQVRLHFDTAPVFPEGFDMPLYIAVGGGLLYAGADASVVFERGTSCVG